MRISRIKVRDLFGVSTFNYDIELKILERITIIHGPNGSGKTVLFKMIDGLFNGRYFVFWKYPFSEFVVDFDSGQSIIVNREFDVKSKRYLTPEIKSSINTQAFKIEIDDRQLRYFVDIPSRRMAIFESEDLVRISREEWYYAPESRELNTAEVIARFGDEFFNVEFKEPKWLKNLREKMRISLINTNRLLINKPDTNSTRRHGLIITSAITENSRNLASRIQEKILEADTQAKTLDRTFPSRVVKSVVIVGLKNVLSYDIIRDELDQLEIKRKRLTEAGLLEPGTQEDEFQIPQSIDSTQQERTLRSVLAMYIHDTQEKLKVYQELADKIELFKDIIQGMLRHKQLYVNKNGFHLRGDNGQPIPLEELSSGEQNIVVVIYNLLFRQYENTDELMLIDEPEISLHISWQKRFINDLARINKLSDFDVIIATHSPSIINGRLDLLVGIQGETDKED